MRMLGFLKEWASNVNFSSGPKAGGASKIMPQAISADGIQPGAGQKLSAEEMNAVLHALVQSRKASILSGLEHRMLEAPSAPSGFARNPVSGALATVLSGVSGQIVGVRPDGTADNLTAIAAGSDETFCVALNLAGPPGLVFAEYASGNVELMRSNGSGSNPDLFTSAGSIAYTNGLPSICYDEVNFSTVGVILPAGISAAAPDPFFILSGGAPAVSAPSSEPTWTNASASQTCQKSIASVGGRTLFMYRTATGLATGVSTDGGDTWAVGTAPSVVGTTYVLWVDAFKDFANEGSQFVVVLFNATDEEILVYRSPDGTSWTLMHDFPTSDATIPSAVLLGDFLIWHDERAGNEDNTKVVDLLTEQIYPLSDELTPIWCDGQRILFQDDSGYFFTPLLNVGRAYSGTQL